MGTMEQLEAQLRPYKLALIEAFGLEEDETARDMSITHTESTFKVIGADPGRFDNATVRHDGLAESIPTVTFDARFWSDAQRKAVSDFIGQFPSAADFPGSSRD